MWPQIVTKARLPRRTRAYAEAEAGFIPEAIAVKPVPQHTDYGSFWSVGKDTRHAWPYRYIYSTDDRATKLTIQAMPEHANQFATFRSAMVQRPRTTPHHQQNPVPEPIQMRIPPPVGWASQHELAPMIGLAPEYLKLI